MLFVITKQDVEAIECVLPLTLPTFVGTMKVYQVIYSAESPDMLVMKSLSCLQCMDCEKFQIGTISYKDNEDNTDDEFVYLQNAWKFNFLNSKVTKSFPRRVKKTLSLKPLSLKTLNLKTQNLDRLMMQYSYQTRSH